MPLTGYFFFAIRFILGLSVVLVVLTLRFTFYEGLSGSEAGQICG